MQKFVLYLHYIELSSHRNKLNSACERLSKDVTIAAQNNNYGDSWIEIMIYTKLFYQEEMMKGKGWLFELFVCTYSNNMTWQKIYTPC